MTTVTQVNARILELVEKGYESSQILAILKEEQELREDPHRLDGEEEGEKETFPDAIRLIAQALAFRDAVDEDVEEVLKLLQDAYQCDIEGNPLILNHTFIASF